MHLTNGSDENYFNDQGQRGRDRERFAAVVLLGIWESAISQNRAQRDDLTDTFIKIRMIGGTTHVSFPKSLAGWLVSK